MDYYVLSSSFYRSTYKALKTVPDVYQGLRYLTSYHYY